MDGYFFDILPKGVGLPRIVRVHVDRVRDIRVRVEGTTSTCTPSQRDFLKACDVDRLAVDVVVNRKFVKLFGSFS